MTTVGMPELRYTPQPQADALQLAEELSEIAERAQTFTAATGVVIALRKRNELVVRTSDGLAPEVGTRIPFPSGVTGLCITTRKPQTCCSADLASQLEAVFRSLDVRSALGTPIERNGEVCGVLVVTSQLSAVFTRTHVALLMTLADVAASKLAQYTALWDVPQKDSSPQILDLDAESLLAASAPAPEPSKPVSSTVSEPVKVSPPVAPAPTTSARVETPVPAPIAKVVPISAPVRSQPSGLVKEAPEVPAKMDPAVLTPAENPIEYGSLIKPKAALAPVKTASRELNLTHTYTPHRTQKSKGSSMPLIGGIAAVLILGLAAALYPRHQAATPPPVATAAAENTVSAAPSNPVPAAAPANSVVQPVTTTAAVPPPANATTKPTELPTAVETPKHVAEAPAHVSTPIHLASAAAKPRSEEAVEAPNLALTATTGKALPDLPIAPAHAVTAPNPAPTVMVSATRLQGKNPVYPPEARRRGESGVVKLMISISAEGKVTDARVLSGNPVFVPTSVAAVRDWTYAPAKLDGKPVASNAEISLRFTAPLQ